MVLEFQREPRIDSESIQDPDFTSVHSSILSVKPLNSITRIGFGVAVTPTQTHYNVWRMSYYGSLDICGAVPADPVDPGKRQASYGYGKSCSELKAALTSEFDPVVLSTT